MYLTSEMKEDLFLPNGNEITSFLKNLFFSFLDQFEGDIIGVNQTDIEMIQSDMGLLAKNAIKHKYGLWPDNIVPYEISRSYSQYERNVIAKAIDEYHEKTCIR